MRKPVIPRIAGFFVLYCAVFVLLGAVQFTKKGKFTQRVGPMLISGYWLSSERGVSVKERPLSGDVSIFFGGLEFLLDDRDGEGFLLLDAEGGKRTALPEYMILEADTARFLLPGGTELAFSVRYSGGPELRISSVFPEGVSGVEIPFKPRRSSSIRENENGRLAIVYNGLKYQFTQSPRWEENGRLVLQPGSPIASYRAIPERQVFNPVDFAIPQTEDKLVFNDAISRWKDQSYSWWNQNISSQNDEDVVIAYSGEAIRRGNYRPALASVSQAFLSGTQRGWESSVYLGGMDRARRIFTAAEQEKTGRISRLINEQSPDFFMENHIIEYLTERGLSGLVDEGLELVRWIDPAELTLDKSPGIFEGYADFARRWPNRDNPFEQFIGNACQFISDNIHREQDKVFVFADTSANIEFNLRLGKAVWEWAEQTGSIDWAGLGRSLVLSALSLSGNSGAAPAVLIRSESGELSEAGGRLSTARMYRILNVGENLPRAVAMGSQGIWAWTAASAISITQEGEPLVISVTFPAGESHFIMLRGIQPLYRIQIYNMDWRSDSQFERYDSSGWVYNAQDQILTLKMRHRENVENIRIFFQAPPPPPRVEVVEETLAETE
ncbi:MAG: hypothetical protein LBH97_04135 [Treponema sp.]|jgi:hypothetical protein|nr:hypothetical protein [Treponema sp.]